MKQTISFNLEDKDIAYFQNILFKTRSNQSKLPEQEILNHTKLLCASIVGNTTPFIEGKLVKLKAFVAMLEEPNWLLPEQERQDILIALNYFNDADDLIPDNIPSLGFLDDAIMIELVADSLTTSIESFQQFCIYRDSEHLRSKDKIVTKDNWLADKRHEKHERVRIRHARDHSKSGSFHSIF